MPLLCRHLTKVLLSDFDHFFNEDMYVSSIPIDFVGAQTNIAVTLQLGSA